MALHWLEEISQVSSVGLTVQAQALSLEAVDPNQQLQHPVFFPYAPTDSVELQSIFETDYRPTADRREWNAPGRFVPTVLPEIEKLTMIPIESYDRLDEEMLQKISEQAAGNEAEYRRLAMLSIPARVDKLVGSNFRRTEVDAMEAWAKGTITVKNPTTGGTSQTLSLGFSASRITTAGTAWDNGGVNAYTLLLSWIRSGEALMGPIVAVKLRRAIFNAIQADAPNSIPGAQSGLLPYKGQIEQTVSQELGHAFSFLIAEETVDLFNDGGTAYTRTAIWPSGYAAAIPASGIIGSTYRAPVARAYELVRQAPGAGIDVRGQTVYYNFENNGRTAVIECQANWLTLPFERNVYSINTQVAS